MERQLEAESEQRHQLGHGLRAHLNASAGGTHILRLENTTSTTIGRVAEVFDRSVRPGPIDNRIVSTIITALSGPTQVEFQAPKRSGPRLMEETVMIGPRRIRLTALAAAFAAAPSCGPPAARVAAPASSRRR